MFFIAYSLHWCEVHSKLELTFSFLVTSSPHSRTRTRTRTHHRTRSGGYARGSEATGQLQPALARALPRERPALAAASVRRGLQLPGRLSHEPRQEVQHLVGGAISPACCCLTNVRASGLGTAVLQF
jgi:hypothetical protein